MTIEVDLEGYLYGKMPDKAFKPKGRLSLDPVKKGDEYYDEYEAARTIILARYLGTAKTTTTGAAESSFTTSRSAGPPASSDNATPRRPHRVPLKHNLLHNLESLLLVTLWLYVCFDFEFSENESGMSAEEWTGFMHAIPRSPTISFARAQLTRVSCSHQIHFLTDVTASSRA